MNGDLDMRAILTTCAGAVVLAPIGFRHARAADIVPGAGMRAAVTSMKRELMLITNIGGEPDAF